MCPWWLTPKGLEASALRGGEPSSKHGKTLIVAACSQDLATSKQLVEQRARQARHDDAAHGSAPAHAQDAYTGPPPTPTSTKACKCTHAHTTHTHTHTRARTFIVTRSVLLPAVAPRRPTSCTQGLR